jgi:hypothetical protein
LVLFLIAISQFYEYLSKLLHFDQNLISILFITIFIIAVYVYIMIKKRT